MLRDDLTVEETVRTRRTDVRRKTIFYTIAIAMLVAGGAALAVLRDVAAGYDPKLVGGGILIIVLVLIFQLKQMEIAVRNATLMEELEKRKDELDAKQKRIEMDLTVARRVLQGLLPSRCPSMNRYAVAARCDPAYQIGGDFYEFVEKNKLPAEEGVEVDGDGEMGTLGIVIGDVAGHGVSSALVMALSSGLFSQVARNISSPAVVLTQVNRSLKGYIKDSDISFVTAIYAELDKATGILRLAKAGHHNPIVYRRTSNSCETIEAPGVFLGMFDDQYEDRSVQLTKGDRLVFYTDGVTDAMNADSEFFGEEALKQVIIQSKDAPAEVLVSAIFRSVDEFTGGKPPEDDRTVLVLDVLA